MFPDQAWTRTPSRQATQMIDPKEFCPRCASARYYGGICLNDDCNYPAMTSNNERRRQTEAEVVRRRKAANEEKARKKAAAAGPGKKPAPAVEKPGTVDTIGKWMAAGAAILGGAWAHRTSPDEPVVWLIVAAIAAVATWWLRKLVIAAAVIAGLLWFLTQNDSDEPAQATVPAKAAVRSDTAQSGAGQPDQVQSGAVPSGAVPAGAVRSDRATVPPVASTGPVVHHAEGFCLINRTGDRIRYQILNGSTRESAFDLEPGYQQIHAMPTAGNAPLSDNVRVDLLSHDTVFPVHTSLGTAKEPGPDAMLAANGCGAPGFPAFSVGFEDQRIRISVS